MQLKVLKRPLLKLYAFNFFQALSWASEKKESTVLSSFWFCFFDYLFVFHFSFRARFPAFFSLVPIKLPIESKVLSRVARTNDRRNFALLKSIKKK